MEDPVSPHSPLLRPKGDSALVKSRRVAYASSCLCCLLSASFTVFSLYTNFFEHDLEYTPLQLNYVSIGAEMGLYLCVPVLGYIADAYRLSYLGIISCLTYLLGYGGCAWVVKTHQSWPWMMLFFAIVGVACSAGFIASLVNCARLYPNSALLAISVPTTLYGCSSLLYARIISSYVEDGLTISGLYLSLSILLAFAGVIAALAPIWGCVDTYPAPLSRDDESAARSTTAEEFSAPVNEESHVARFFKESHTLWLLVSFVLVSGPLEMYQNNMGLVIATREEKSTDNVARQVALFTGFSTIIRLVCGAITDIFAIRPSVLLLFTLAALSVVDFAFAQGWAGVSLMSSISGIGYGSSFTMYPLIVSQVCGMEKFATYWGIFILGPAVGSFIFGVLFATNVQQSADYSATFQTCALGVLLSCFIIIRLRSYLA